MSLNEASNYLLSSNERRGVLEALNYILTFPEDIGEDFLKKASPLMDCLNVAVSSGLARKIDDYAIAVVGTDIDNYTLYYDHEHIMPFEKLSNLKRGILLFDLEQPSVYFTEPIPLEEIVFHHTLPEDSGTRMGLFKTPRSLLEKYEATKRFPKILPKVKNCIFYDNKPFDYYDGEILVYEFLKGNMKINYDNLEEAPEIHIPIKSELKTIE